MSARTTPLGFLPGDMDVRTHCMFVYANKDAAFIQSVADYIAAGVKVGELCVCATDQSVRERLHTRLAEMGVQPNMGQVQLPDASDVYVSDGWLDADKAAGFWHEQLVLARSRWKGLRAFGDTSTIPQSRAGRLKLLEYESRLNLYFGANIGLCAYPCTGFPRSFVSHVKDLHPFIANGRCIKRNHRYQTWDKFVAGFYRCRRVSKTYQCSSSPPQDVYVDLEEIAARTLLSMREIKEFKEAVSTVLSQLIRPDGEKQEPAQVQVTFRADSGAFAAGVKFPTGHGMPCSSEQLNVGDLRSRLQEFPLDEVRVDCKDGAAIVILVKRYRNSNARLDSELDADWL